MLDLTNVPAGPSGAYPFALLGADAINGEIPAMGDSARQSGADPAPNQATMGAPFLASNAGMRSKTLNLKSTLGRLVLERSVATAEVAVENVHPGVLDRLGLGIPGSRRSTPGLLSARSPASAPGGRRVAIQPVIRSSKGSGA